MEKLYGIGDIDIGGNATQTNLLFDIHGACMNSFLSESMLPGVDNSYCFMKDGNICFGYQNEETKLKTMLVLNPLSMRRTNIDNLYSFSCHVYVLDGRGVELDKKNSLPLNCDNIGVTINIDTELFFSNKDYYGNVMTALAKRTKELFAEIQAQELAAAQQQGESKTLMTVDMELIQVNRKLQELNNQLGFTQSHINKLLANGIPDTSTKNYSEYVSFCGVEDKIWKQISELCAKRNTLNAKYVQNMQNTASSYGSRRA